MDAGLRLESRPVRCMTWGPAQSRKQRCTDGTRHSSCCRWHRRTCQNAMHGVIAVQGVSNVKLSTKEWRERSRWRWAGQGVAGKAKHARKRDLQLWTLPRSCTLAAPERRLKTNVQSDCLHHDDALRTRHPPHPTVIATVAAQLHTDPPSLAIAEAALERPSFPGVIDSAPTR